MLASWLLPFLSLLTVTTASPHAHVHPHPRDARRQFGDTIDYYAGNSPNNGNQAGSAGSSTSQDPPAATTSASSSSGGGGGGSSVKMPSNCYTVNGLAVGVDSQTAASSITSETLCMYGNYAALSSSGMDDLTDDAGQASGSPVWVISLNPKSSFSDLATQEVATSVKDGITKAQSTFKGQIWVRLAYEFNWYLHTQNYTGSSTDFKNMWTSIAGAVQSDTVKMFWCPNPPSSTPEYNVDDFYPGSQYVDLVGIDAYQVNSDSTFSDAVPTSFCNQYSDKSLVVGEAGVQEPDPGGTTAEKTHWLQQIVCGTSSCSNYVGFMWYEYPSWGIFNDAGNGIASSVFSNPSCGSS